MRNFLIFCCITVLHIFGKNAVQSANMICYYDTTNISDVQQAMHQLDPALQFCNYLIYGYAGIDPETYQLKTLDRSLNYDLYHAVTALKRNHRHLRVLLSVGGDRDYDIENDNKEGKPDCGHADSNKYLMLLENIAHRNAFINSAQMFVRTYGFDGLDLGWQFPKNPPKENYSGIKKAWNKFKGWFRGRRVLDEKSAEHKEQFVGFVRELKQALSAMGGIMTMTVLPHVPAEIFLDIPAIMPQLDFVTLATFDYNTPDRDPKTADYSASIYKLLERDPTLNIDNQIQHWLNETTELSKIIMGIPAYGRAWIMTKESGLTGYPPIPAGGPAAAGNYTKTPGLLSWPEICGKMHQNKDLTGDLARLHKVGDPTKRYGSYCYRAADDNGDHGLWISYEEPTTVSNKAGYARVRDLGGVALFDLTKDDVMGSCGDGKYPLLRSIKYKL